MILTFRAKSSWPFLPIPAVAPGPLTGIRRCRRGGPGTRLVTGWELRADQRARQDGRATFRPFASRGPPSRLPPAPFPSRLSWASFQPPCTLSARGRLPLLLPLVEPRVVPGVIPRHEEPLQPLVLHCGVHYRVRKKKSLGGEQGRVREVSLTGAKKGVGGWRSGRSWGFPRRRATSLRNTLVSKTGIVSLGPRKCHGFALSCAN